MKRINHKDAGSRKRNTRLANTKRLPASSCLNQVKVTPPLPPFLFLVPAGSKLFRPAASCPMQPGQGHSILSLIPAQAGAKTNSGCTLGLNYTSASLWYCALCLTTANEIPSPQLLINGGLLTHLLKVFITLLLQSKHSRQINGTLERKKQNNGNEAAVSLDTQRF